jgi:hypothetical protein
VPNFLTTEEISSTDFLEVVSKLEYLFVFATPFYHLPWAETSRCVNTLHATATDFRNKNNKESSWGCLSNTNIISLLSIHIVSHFFTTTNPNITTARESTSRNLAVSKGG